MVPRFLYFSMFLLLAFLLYLARAACDIGQNNSHGEMESGMDSRARTRLCWLSFYFTRNPVEKARF
jgi:hypothetical protein